uniref:Reverse transcriptase Ty1/copia-type domain-containing protein n=1 Tax=Tanacetum cinerariifolium TaxID=118510 RepID=A0A699H9P2_TANCI|nr:hypothetical protein [Tanacetum cinerariifolium]
MNKEIEALNRNNTSTICDHPDGKKLVGSKWLYKINEKSKVCKLNKSLYGIKESPRQWNAKLTKALVINGFVQSKFDYSLLTKKYDDMFIARDLGKLKYFLRVEVLDNKDGICLSQRKYCLELLHEYGMLAAKHIDTLLSKNTTLNHAKSDDDHLLSNVGNYQRLVGKFIYLTNTRPVISYVVHCLSQFMHALLESRLDAVLRVLRYLNGSPGSGFQINKHGNLKLSSAEVGYRSMASATCEVIWLSNLLGHMAVKGMLHVVLYCDNSSALQIAANLTFADVLTKALDIEQHKALCEKLGMLDMLKVEKLKGWC